MIQDYGENEFPSGENFECSECHKMFKYESHFSRHILTHSDQRPYACGSCGKKFKRQDALKTHERTHSDDLPFKCSQAECLERFASKAALRYHELRHANQSEFICDIDGCNKKFLTLGQLKQHQRTKIHSKSVQILNGEIRIQDNQVDSVQRQQSQSQLSSNPPQQSSSVNIQFPNDFKNSSQLSASSSVAASSLINISGKKRSFEELKQHSIAGIKKEQQNQVEGFLDYFSEDEQAFIDQIWSTIKQENHANNTETDNTHQNNQIQLNQELQEQSQYLTSKRRHLSSFGQASISQQCSSSHSDLLLEFSRISSSGNSSSFGRLKQELRIIVGLIDKIKKEDQEIFAQDPEESNHGVEPIQRESIKREMHERNQEDNSFNNNNNNKNNQSYHDNQRQNRSFESQEAHQNEEINEGFSESPKQNFQFYQHDESPFHDYDCQFLHKSIPSEIVKEINQEDDENKTMDSTKLLNRPLLKRKIKTAVRLVQYCKKVFLDERKQAIQQEQQLRRQQELLQQQYKREQQEQQKQQQQQQQQIQEMNLQKLFAQSSQFQMKQPVLMQAPWNNGVSQILVQENMNFPENSNSQFFSGDDQSMFFSDCFNPMNSQIMNSCQLGRQNSLNLSMNPIIQRNSSQINHNINQQQQLIHQIAPANQQQFFTIKNMNNFNNLNHAIQSQPQISYSQIIPSLSGLSNISSSIQSSIPSSKPLNNNLSPSCHPSPSRSDNNSLRLCMSSEVEGGSHINREPMPFGNIFDAADEIGSINQDYAFLEELASFNACMQAPSPINDPTRNM